MKKLCNINHKNITINNIFKLVFVGAVINKFIYLVKHLLLLYYFIDFHRNVFSRNLFILYLKYGF